MPSSPFQRGAVVVAAAAHAAVHRRVCGTPAAAEIGYSALSSHQAERVAAGASANVARLTTEPVGPLVELVFVIEDYGLTWRVLGMLGCALAEAQRGWP